LTQGRLRARRDLVLTPSGDATVVKDPLSLEYFRLGDRESFLLRTLHEPMTVGDLTRRFQRQFPNERATGAQVLGFCASLYDCSLLLSDAATDPRRPSGKAPWYASLVSPLAIRLPGLDPTPLLRVLWPFGAVLFSRAFAAMLLLAAAVVGLGLLGKAEVLTQELSRMLDLFSPIHATMAVLAVVVVKAWHELGHAMACRRMGAECHEVGVLLLAFLPCLYCDVSDAWSLTSRWRRAVVALGGVYFELMLAVAAGAAWLVLAPGPLRMLSLYVVVVASVSTLLVNLNPLLRYDGYYVLADAWGVANLHMQSREALWGPLRRWVRRDHGAAEAFDASPRALAAYGLASTVYGWFILGLILWGLHHALAAAGFRAAGDLLVALSLGGVAIFGLRRLVGLLPRGADGRMFGVLFRLGVVAGVAALALGGLASLPIDQTLHSVCRVESDAYADVVSRSPGVLRPHVRYGDVVDPGDLVAELVDTSADFRRLELLQREAELAAEIAGLRTRSQSDAGLLAEVARLEPTLAEVRRQVRSHDELTERRRLRAPIGGRIDPPVKLAANNASETQTGDLPTWSGSPLDPSNDGCWLEADETVCRVTGEGLQVVLLLSEDDSGLVRVGDPVRILLDRAPSETLTARVEGVALAAADEAIADPERLLEKSLRSPLEKGAAYRLNVELIGEAIPELQPGALGQARVVTGRETLGGWASRWLRQLLRFG
jgi:putative peptide zinc metalloprotease protein